VVGNSEKRRKSSGELHAQRASGKGEREREGNIRFCSFKNMANDWELERFQKRKEEKRGEKLDHTKKGASYLGGTNFPLRPKWPEPPRLHKFLQREKGLTWRG